MSIRVSQKHFKRQTKPKLYLHLFI